jgi:hypothetical protein
VNPEDWEVMGCGVDCYALGAERGRGGSFGEIESGHW